MPPGRGVVRRASSSWCSGSASAFRRHARPPRRSPHRRTHRRTIWPRPSALTYRHSFVAGVRARSRFTALRCRIRQRPKQSIKCNRIKHLWTDFTDLLPEETALATVNVPRWDRNGRWCHATAARHAACGGLHRVRCRAIAAFRNARLARRKNRLSGRFYVELPRLVIVPGGDYRRFHHLGAVPRIGVVDPTEPEGEWYGDDNESRG